MSPQPAFYDDLDEALRASWNLLGRGVADRRSGFHTLSLATIGLSGAPRLRTVVSRNVDWSARSLRFHCDRRSDKFAEIRSEPRIALHGYDPGAKIQVRLEGRGALHTEGSVADEAWAASRISSRIGYGTDPAPGTILDEGGGFNLPAGDEEIAAGRVHFCAVVAKVEIVEFLYLAFEGHRRARFEWKGEQWKGAWLAP